MSFSKTSPLNINTRAIDLVSNGTASVPPFKLKRVEQWAEPWNMARLLRVAAQKSRRLTSPKSTASHCILATHNNAVIVLNQCLALHPLHANIVGDNLLADVLQCPLPRLPLLMMLPRSLPRRAGSSPSLPRCSRLLPRYHPITAGSSRCLPRSMMVQQRRRWQMHSTSCSPHSQDSSCSPHTQRLQSTLAIAQNCPAQNCPMQNCPR